MRPGVGVFSVILALALLAAPAPSDGQQPGKVYRIGWLTNALKPKDPTPQNCPRNDDPFWRAWLDGLQERGYNQGQNLVIECRWTEGRDDRAPALAAELVTLKVDLIVAGNTAQVRAAKQATSTIPIVMRGVLDPVRRGLVESLAHPGGNVTGQTDDAGLDILGRRLQLLTQVVPKATRIATLHPPVVGAGNPPATHWPEILEAEARALGVSLHPYRFQGPEDLEGVFVAMTKARAEALFVVPHPFFNVHHRRLIDLAAQHRLPAIYSDRLYVAAGGLMAYGVNELATVRRLSTYVDRIFKGANPGDLPVEQPTEFTLILNLKTAKALGLTFPETLLIQAEEQIR